MPRAQDFLSGAVWIIILTSILNKGAKSFDVHQLEAGKSGFIDGFDEADLFDREWTAKDLEILKLVMDEHVTRLKEELEAISFASSRSKREVTSRTPTVTGTNRIPSVHLNSTASQLKSQGSISCFVWKKEHFCILGGTIFPFKNGKIEPFVSGLPVGENDHVKVHVYDNAIFLAIFNKDTASLRLYILQSPGWIRLNHIQVINGKVLEDCVFFENEGNLYMALAIEQGPMQYEFKSVGMHCVIYRWLGTTMDEIHKFGAPGLRKIGVLQSQDSVDLALIQGNSSVHLTRFSHNGLEYQIELLEIIETQLRIIQFEAFLMDSQWCILLGGSDSSHIYCHFDQRLLLWQVFSHNHTSNPASWIRINQEGVSNNYHSTMLIFNAHDSQSQFEYYTSDPSGYFSLTFITSNLKLDGIPLASIAFLDDSTSAHFYIATMVENEFFLEGFAIQLAEQLENMDETDPLLECLSDLDFLISQHDTATVDKATQLMNNMVHFKDNFTTNATLIITQMNYSQPPELGEVKVLYNFTEKFKPPKEIESSIKELQLSARNLSLDLANLLHVNDSTFKGHLRFNGMLTADEIVFPSASVNYLNGRVWDNFVKQTWRYSGNYSIPRDIKMGKVKAENVSLGSTISGTLPSNWLLKSGGELSGQTTFASLDVRDSIDIGNHLINGLAMEDVLLNNESTVTIQGLKSFAGIQVQNVTADNINERNFSRWADTLIMQRSEKKQHFSGSVHLKGPVHVVHNFHSDSINGINVSSLPEILVDKTAHQIITGVVNFTGPLSVSDAQVGSINDVLIDDILSTSGRQTIRASINVDILDVKGELECSDINGQNVDDFVYTDEEGLQVIQGPVRFENDLEVEHLVIKNGTLNGLDVVNLLNPESLRIDSQIQIDGDLTAFTAHVKEMNGIELSDIRNRYWTKSTNQTIQVNVRMPFEVIVKENITTRTFMDRFLDRDFFLTKSNETFKSDVVFKKDVTFSGNLTIDDLKDINGVTLQSLDEDVVKKEGDFQILGHKTFEHLIIEGNLEVEETFNKLRIPQDIVLLNRSQTLTGIHFGDDVTVDGDVLSALGNITLNMVAGIQLDDFVATAAMIDEDAIFDGTIRFQRHLDVSHMVVEDLMNGHSLNDIVNKGLRRDNQDVLGLSNLTVYGHVTFQDSVDTRYINSYNVDEYLGKVVNMSNPKVITGIKKTVHPIVAEKANFQLFNGVPLDFGTLLTVSGNQTITGEYVLDNLASFKIDLNMINGRNLSDYVKTADTNEIQIITGEMNIENIDVTGSLKIEDQVLNGCKLTHYRDITNFTHFESLSIQNGTLLLEQPEVNNPELATIAFKALRKDRPQVITGNVTLMSDVIMEKLNVTQKFAGSVDLDELLHGSMLKSVEQNVSGTLIYVKGIKVGSIEKVGQLKIKEWNGKDVQKMVDQVVLKTGNQTVRAKKNFIADLNVKGNLQINGTIDGVPVSTLVKVNQSELPNGIKFNNLVIKNQLNVTSGMIDGINITSVLQQRVPLRGDSIIKANITFTNSVTAGNLNATMINNVNMTDLVLKTSAPGQKITGKKILNGTLDIEGDIRVNFLNGKNLEDITAFVVLQNENAKFERSVDFLGGLTIMKHLNVTTFNGGDANQLISTASMKVPEPRKSTISKKPAYPLLMALQKSTQKLATFEYFEPIQQISFSFPRGSNESIQIQNCPIPVRKQSSTKDTAAGILITTHSTDGSSCKLKKPCRCHRSVTFPSDVSGQVNTLRLPTRLKNYMEDNLMYSDRVRLLTSKEHLFVIGIESLPGCLVEKVTIAVVNPLTFKVLTETAFELNDTVVDVALEQWETNGQIILAVSQKFAGVWLYTFDGDTYRYRVLIETERVASIHMASYKDSMFLAVATYGLEAVSSIWKVTSTGKIELVKDCITVGATDVLFTKSDDTIYVTFSQDPSSIDSYTDNFSQFKVPAQVLMYIPSFESFEVVQQLDIDRILSLTNLLIDGDPFLAVATFTSKVRIYRLINGQGFKAVQTFKNPGVRSIAGYSIGSSTYLATVSESRLAIFVARLRGPTKPTLKL